MTPQRGENRGVTGLVKLSGVPKFRAEITFWQQGLAIASKPRAGRNGGIFPKSRLTAIGGTLTLKGKATSKQPPSTATFQGQEGMVTITWSDKTRMDVPVRVTGWQLNLDTDKEERWNVTYACEITGQPQWLNWPEDAPAADAIVKADEEVYAGLSKTYDPNNLATSATRSWDVWPLTNTDAAERQKLVDLVAVATAGQFAGAKVKTATLQPGRDWDGGLATVILSLTDTKEDLLNPRNVVKTDPQGLETAGTVSDLNATPGIPAGLKNRGESLVEQHDAAIVHDVEVGVRTTKEDREWLQSKAGTEPGQIAPDYIVVRVTTSNVPPDPTGINPDAANLSYAGADSHQETDTLWVHVLYFKPLTAQETREEEYNEDVTDPSSLDDENHRRQITNSSVPPAAPAVAGKVNFRKRTKRIAKARWQHDFDYAYRSTEAQREADEYEDTVDSGGMTDARVTADVYPVAGVPANPAAPTGLKLRDLVDRETRNPAIRLRVYHWARRTTRDDRNTSEYLDADDVSDLDDQTVRINWSNNGTPPAAAAITGQKLRDTKTYYVHDALYMHVYSYGLRTRQDETEQDGSELVEDANDLGDRRVICLVQTGAAAWPSTPSGLKQHHYEEKQRTDTKFVRTYYFSRRDLKDEITLDGTWNVADPQLLEGEGLVTELYITGAEPGDPFPPTSELVLDTKRYRVINNKWTQRDTKFNVTNSAQRVTFKYAKDTSDPNALDQASVKASIFTVGSPPGTPAAPTGTKIVNFFDVPLTNGKSARVWLYGTKDSIDEVEFKYERVVIDPNGLEDAEIIASVWDTVGPPANTPPADPATPAGLTLVTKADYPLTFNRKVRVWAYEKLSTAGKILYQHKWTESDADTITDQASDAAFDAAAPAAPAGYSLHHSRRVELNGGHYFTQGVYKRLTPKEELELENSEATYLAIENDVYRTATIAACLGTDTEQALAAAIQNTNANDPTFNSVRVRKVNKTTALRIIERTPNYQYVTANLRGGLLPSPSRLAGGTTVQAYVRAKRKVATNYWWFHVINVPQYIGRMDLTLRRRLVKPVVLYTSLLGKSNNAAFMGLPQGEVVYNGLDPVFDAVNANKGTAVVTRYFTWFMGGAYYPDGINTGWQTTTADLTSASLGTGGNWVNASTLGYSNAVVAVQGDFSVFTT
jgi:hypothetical protein